MDATARIKACLDKWSNGGEAECRSYLASSHGHIYESARVDVLMTAYQALIRTCLSSKDSKPCLTAGDLAGFIQSIVGELPSSSSPTSDRSRSLNLFGELLVDVLWTIDSELSDVITDADAILKKTDKIEEGKEAAEANAKADSARKTAQSDRETLSTFLKALIRAEVVEASICRERLDSCLLSATGLIGDKDAFDRREIRARTGLFYKQNKFNLLREQSEGYSKLTVDLISSLGPPNVPATATPVESFQAVQTRASAVWERVVSLIGYFDLDPNRALDIILDVFSVNIATHWHFFLALLACSPWIGDNTRLKDWSEGTNVERDANKYRGKTLDEVLRLAESNARGVRPGMKPDERLKPRVLAQVLGFKFNHYQSQDTKVPCPRGLYLVAALLIREEFISLEDLYPHLSPSDDDMPKLRQKYLDDVQSRIKSSSNNLLSMAAPLESSSFGSSAKSKTPAAEAKAQQDAREAPAQKGMLAVALLSVGDLRRALALLSEFPWLIDVHRELADLLLRVLKASINPLYEKLFNKERNKGFLQPRARYISPGVLVTPVRKPQLTLCAPPPPSTQTQDFVFFYPHWSDWVPICETSDDVIDVIEPLMRFIGVHVGRDTLFLTKLLRIGRHHLLQSLTTEPENKDAKRPVSVITDPENGVQEFWLQVSRRYLLPALSMLPGNAVCTVEVWSILRFYDLTVRWRLYGEWRDKTYKSHPELNAQRILREREAKGILRRLSSQTVESLAGAVAKMAHANPCLFFMNAVNQIQAYDNLTDVVIQALRFATNMGFDVLVFLVIDALANPRKDRVKEDGANTADWLQSLATFSGALFRRYSTDLSSLLKYIVHQLYNGQTSEIVVLEKLILRMAGIEPLPSLSDTQVIAMAGGPTLRTEAIASDLRGAGLDSSEAQTKGPQRLGRSLIDTGLAFPILVQVAQQRQACIFKARDAHLKSIAHLFDATHGVLFQYLELLTTPTVVPLEDYRGMIPSLSDLVNVYGISPPIALQIYRPMLNDAVYTHASEWCKAREAEKIEQAEAAERRLKAALAAKRESPNSSAASAETSAQDPSTGESKVKAGPNGVPPENIELDAAKQKASDDALNKADSVVEAKTEATEFDPWVPELRTLSDACKQIAPGNAFDAIGWGFYLSFWQMSSYDLYFPKEKYAELEKNLLTTADSLNAKARQADRSTDRSIRATVLNIKLQRDRYYNAVSDLRKEKAIQETIYRYTTEKGGRLDREKDHWFSHVLTGSAKAATLIQSLIENCIQPRCLLSPMDAVYCARLIRTLHERGTPGFHTLMCYDKLLGDHVKVVIFSCSENEARNYGRFLKGVLQGLHEWHKDQKAYEANSYRKEDSKVVLLPGLQTHWSKDGPSSADDLLKWTGFKSFLKKCHRKLGQSFTECIQAGDFMHVYNAVLVLKEIIDVFPLAAVNEVVGSSIDLEIQRLVQSEERGDLKILARAYSSSLKKREKLWALPKEQPAVPAKATSSTVTVQVEKSREPIVATVPTGPRSTQTSASVGAEKATTTAVERPSSAAKFNVESVPRPEVVKRNREPKAPEINAEASKKEEPMQVDPQPNGHNQDRSSNVDASPVQKHDVQLPNQSLPPRGSSRLSASLSSTDLRKEVLQGISTGSRPGTPVPLASVGSMQNASKESPHSSPRSHDRDQGSPMAPPAEPSQAPHAQELRNARRQERVTNSPREVRPDTVDSSARRSPSPASRPGTRNASADSRTSEGRRERRRHERTSETEAEDSRKPANVDVPSRAERSHRDTHGRSERSGRDRIPGSSTRDTERERDLDRERTRDRDRHGDRQRDREREKSHRSERESHRDRERERDRGDRDKDRDRHRRDEKDRDRERKPSGSSKEPGVPLEHPLPSRPDTQRHRTHTDSSQGDVTLGKRRRTPDVESERNAKRSSRQRDDRSRRTSDKESSREQNRESDRRRTDREAQEDEQPSKEAVPEKAEKNFNRLRDSDASPAAVSLKVTVPPPSAPRAMAGPSPRIGGRAETSPVVTPREREQERDWEARDRERAGRGDRSHSDLRTDRGGTEREDRERDRSDRIQRSEREWKEGPGRAGQNGTIPSTSLGSLRDRISSAPGDAPVAGNPSGRTPFGEPSRDDYNERLKRSSSDRDRDALQGPAPAASNVPPPKSSSSKRIRIDRSRLAGDGASSKRTVRQ